MYGAAAGTIDLGDDPPLVVGRKEEKQKAPLQRGVSWRWMTGTVLTGVTSIALMGGALMAALNNPNQFAALPDSLARIAAGTSDIVFGQKGDRIRPEHEEVANRQIIQVSTVTRQGERDFIKLKPFAKITATLSLKPDQTLEAQVPTYDPMRLFADTSAPEPAPAPGEAGAADTLYGANVDGEVSVKVTAFPLDATDFEPAAIFQTAQAEQVIRSAAQPAVPTVIDPTVMAYGEAADYGSGDSLDSDFGVRITPENVSNIAKSDESAGSGDGFDEQLIAVGKKGDLNAILKDAGVGDQDAGQIVGALSQLMDVSKLHAGQKVRLALSAEPGEDNERPMRVSVYEDGVHQATVARADDNNFVRGDEPTSPLDSLYADAEPAAPTTGGPEKLYDAVYQTALEQQIPQPLIEQLIRIFAFDVDFTARANAGDAIEVLHSMPDPSDRDAGDAEILYAAINIGATPKRFYRFRTPDDGIVDYYDEDGRSAKKFLIRKPIPTGRLTSGFGYRRHPILGRTRLHPGVDYGSPRGTPIFAAGNGIVEKAGRSSGYGNLIIIKHTNGYETAYGHQQAFAKGIKPGVRVRQGQVIGYVGSTGLSTGPHLHFEIRVNRQPVDPLRIRLPRGRVLQGEYLQAFERERQRIDTLLGNQAQAPQKVAAAQ